MSTYFTSDLHFGHKNLTQGLRNMSAEESDALIIERWNNIINKNDAVYILGDITMEKKGNIEMYLKQLKGNITIIGGNHDTKPCCREFQRLGIVVMGVLNYKGFLCTHIPVHETQLVGFKGNIHGHIHINGIIDGLGNYNPPKIEGKYFNVNTELHNYTPISFDEIVNYFGNLEKI